jgi:hypothetical protein
MAAFENRCHQRCHYFCRCRTGLKVFSTVHGRVSELSIAVISTRSMPGSLLAMLIRSLMMVPHVWPAHAAGLELERVVAAVVVGIEPLPDRVSLEPGLIGLRPGPPVGVDAAR